MSEHGGGSPRPPGPCKRPGTRCCPRSASQPSVQEAAEAVTSPCDRASLEGAARSLALMDRCCGPGTHVLHVDVGLRAGLHKLDSIVQGQLRGREINMQHQPPGTQTSARCPEGGRDRQTEWGLLPQATSGEQVVNVRGGRVEGAWLKPWLCSPPAVASTGPTRRCAEASRAHPEALAAFSL